MKKSEYKEAMIAIKNGGLYGVGSYHPLSPGREHYATARAQLNKLDGHDKFDLSELIRYLKTKRRKKK